MEIINNNTLSAIYKDFLKEKYRLNINSWIKKLEKNYVPTISGKKFKIYQYYFGETIGTIWVLSVIIEKRWGKKRIFIDFHSQAYDILIRFKKNLKLVSFSRPNLEAERKKHGMWKENYKISRFQLLIMKKAMLTALQTININSY